MRYDLTEWDARIRFSREVVVRGPMEPTTHHFTLLRETAQSWSMSEVEFGAPEIDGKRPYGNSDVEDDLAELLPNLSPEDRLRIHCELPAVLSWLCLNAHQLLTPKESA